MNFLGWNSECELGISEFDENNKIIVAIFNQILKLFYENQLSKEFHKLYATLIMYAKKEFDLEQELMKKVKFNQSTLHINQHNEFFHKIDQIANVYISGEIPFAELHKFANKWLSSHIKQTDRKLISLYYELHNGPFASPEKVSVK